MKKSALAFAALSLVSGLAAAQSSVTVFGIVDVAMRNMKGVDDVRMVQSEGRSTSRLGFRGVEDIGGGMKAAFWLETGIFADTGATDSAVFWQRRATVSLMGSFGEVRIGRAKWSSRLVQDDFDPFQTGGMPSVVRLLAALPASTNANGVGSGATIGTQNRADNQVAWVAPAMAGFYANAEVAAGEGTNDANKGMSGRVGYKAGALHVAGAYSQHGASGVAKFKSANLGGSYDFGAVQIMGLYVQNKRGDAKQNLWNVGGWVPMGPGKLIVSFAKADGNNTTQFGAAFKQKNDASLFAVGYDYALSKRTTLYTTYARIKNNGAGTFSLNNTPSAPSAAIPRIATATADAGNATGYDVGIRHSF